MIMLWNFQGMGGGIKGGAMGGAMGGGKSKYYVFS